MSKVTSLDDKRPHYVVMALCLQCKNTWIGTVIQRTNLFQLQCPKCEYQRSFASFMPDNYLEDHCDDYQPEGA